MHRTDAADNVANLFSDGNPGIGQAATVVDAAWLNDVQENICDLITGYGVTLVKADYGQLLTALASLVAPPGGRLTLSTGVPVTTGDVSGAASVLYTPHKSDRIALYDGTRWVPHQFTELSQATTDATKSPAAVANNSNYDIFVWNDAGTLRATRGPAWSSDTSRGVGAGTTELLLFQGRMVNKNAITNGPAANAGLYVGTVRSDGAAQINDTAAKRHVWNAYNRVARQMKVVEATTSWAYTTAAWRQANGNAANQLDIVVGLAEDSVDCRALGVGGASAVAGQVSSGIGVDSTTVNSADIFGTFACNIQAIAPVPASYSGVLAIGRHTLTWLEYGNSAATFYGTDSGGAAPCQAGISARVMA